MSSACSNSRRPSSRSIERPPESRSTRLGLLGLDRLLSRELALQKTVKAKKAELEPPPPNEVLLRREVAGFENLRTFTSCSVPLNVIVNRDLFACSAGHGPRGAARDIA